jgi:hypothetical protein
MGVSRDDDAILQEFARRRVVSFCRPVGKQGIFRTGI